MRLFAKSISILLVIMMTLSGFAVLGYAATQDQTYTIYYYNNAAANVTLSPDMGDSLIEDYHTGDEIPMPAFDGYEIASIDIFDNNNAITDGVVHNSDVYVNIYWKYKEYKIIYQWDIDGDVPPEITLPKTIEHAHAGDQIALPNMKAVGYDFHGWTVDGDQEGYVFDQDVVVTGKWDHYTRAAIFLKEDGTILDAREYHYGDKIEVPNEDLVVKPGYRLVGWYNDKGGWEDFDQWYMGEDDLIVYPKYTPNQYVVTFIDGDQVISERLQSYGDQIIFPEVPGKDGYIFVGWDLDIDTVPAEDVVLHAVWAPQKYHLTATTDDVVIYDADLEYGAEISIPIESKDGYTLVWDEEAPDTMPASDLVLKGSYVKNQYQVEFYSCGRVVQTMTASYEDTIVLPGLNDIGDSMFAGWASTDGSETADYAVGTRYSVICNVALYAVWTKAERTPTIEIRNMEKYNNQQVGYKTTMKFTADVQDLPAGASVRWVVLGQENSNSVDANDRICVVKDAKADYTIQAQVIDANGHVITSSETETIHVKHSFFARLIAFFKMLFGLLPMIEQ